MDNTADTTVKENSSNEVIEIQDEPIKPPQTPRKAKVVDPPPQIEKKREQKAAEK